jgi:hypothetical protein
MFYLFIIYYYNFSKFLFLFIIQIIGRIIKIKINILLNNLKLYILVFKLKLS